MSGYNHLVSPRSWEKIEAIVNDVRGVLELSNEPYFPVMTVIECILDHEFEILWLEVGSRDDMGDAEGLTCPEGTFIRLRGDVSRCGRSKTLPLEPFAATGRAGACIPWNFIGRSVSPAGTG